MRVFRLVLQVRSTSASSSEVTCPTAAPGSVRWDSSTTLEQQLKCSGGETPRDPSSREAENPLLLNKLLLFDTFSHPKPDQRDSLFFCSLLSPPPPAVRPEEIVLTSAAQMSVFLSDDGVFRATSWEPAPGDASPDTLLESQPASECSHLTHGTPSFSSSVLLSLS